MRKKALSHAILFAFGSVLLTGCGGGGGTDSASTDSGSSASIIPAATKVIDETNAISTVQDALNPFQAASPLHIASAGSSPDTRQFIDLEDLSSDLLKKTLAEKNESRVHIQATTQYPPEQCYIPGGTIQKAVTDMDNNENTLQAGDTVSYVFNNCQDYQDGPILNGKYTTIADEVTRYYDIPSGFDEAATGRLIYEGASVTLSGNTYKFNGTVFIDYDGKYEDKYENGQFVSKLYDYERSTLTSSKLEFSINQQTGALYELYFKDSYDKMANAWQFERDMIMEARGEVIKLDTTKPVSGTFTEFDTTSWKSCGTPTEGTVIIYGYKSSVSLTVNPDNTTVLEVKKQDGTTIIKQYNTSEVLGRYCN